MSQLAEECRALLRELSEAPEGHDSAIFAVLGLLSSLIHQHELLIADYAANRRP